MIEKNKIEEYQRWVQNNPIVVLNCNWSHYVEGNPNRPIRSIKGTVKNNTSNMYRNVEISINIYNRNWVKTVDVSCYLRNLEPGGTAQFETDKITEGSDPANFNQYKDLKDMSPNFKIVSIKGR